MISRGKRGWSLAATALLFGNLANILESTKKLSNAAYNAIVFAWHGSHVIPISLVIVGYLIVGVLIFRVLVKRTSSKPMATAGAFCPVLILGVVNLFVVPPSRTPEGVWRPDVKRIGNRLLAASGRGFRWDPGNPTSEVQSWSTAQAVVGLLSTPSKGVEHKAEIRIAFDAIEAQRAGDGWGYWPESGWTVTEITAWVSLAYIHSLPAGIWTDSERPEVIGRISRDLASIVSRQDASGGWRPINERDAALTRTYSTLIALWAVVDARGEPLLTSAVGDRYDQSIKLGVNWLLNGYHSPSGWRPNPNRADFREAFPGLTTQTLFVLGQAARVLPGAVTAESTLKEAKHNFVTSLAVPQCAAMLNSRVPDADVHLRPSSYVLEGSTFLWFPWTLAVLTDMATDSELAEQDQLKASRLRDQLLARHDEIVAALDAGLTYELAENLFCLNHALNRSSAQHAGS